MRLNTHPDVVQRCNQMKTKYMYKLILIWEKIKPFVNKAK